MKSGIHESNILSTSIDIIDKYDIFDTAEFAAGVSDKYSHLFLNEHKLRLLASVTKIFTTATALILLGPHFTIETPIITYGDIEGDLLYGNLVLIGSGDYTFGGRRISVDKIAYTEIDHSVSEYFIELTPQDPLLAIKNLASQIYDIGIRRIYGTIKVDDSLFDPITIGEPIIISPISINENIIDITLNATCIGKRVTMDWRPKVSGYNVINKVITSKPNSFIDINVEYKNDNKTIIIDGSIPITQKQLITRALIKDPKHFAKRALIDALNNLGIEIMYNDISKSSNKRTILAKFKSVPLSQMIKLVNKTSTNQGANNLVLLISLLDAHKGSLEEGMRIMGNYLKREVKIKPEQIVLRDGSGVATNFATPRAIITLLDFMKSQTKQLFCPYIKSLPISGVDGSLETTGNNLKSKGHIYAKTGTFVYNNLLNSYWNYTENLAGYVKTASGKLLSFTILTNNAIMLTNEDNPKSIFNNISQLSNIVILVPNNIYFNY